ncbi:SWIM zinc finger family protein [Pseudoneobacillus sp. C159]
MGYEPPNNIEEDLELLAGELSSRLEPHSEEDAKLVEKGMLLYRQGLVYQMKFEADQVHATVQDVTPVKVRLDLTFFDTSDCDCPHHGICRHKLAVFFAAYSQVSSVSEWVQKWRQPIKLTKLATQMGLQRAKDLLKTRGALKSDYDSWINAFDESFQTILTPKKIPNPYVLNELFQVYQRRIRASAPLEREWNLLYELVATVFTFKKILDLTVELDDIQPEALRYFSPLLDDLTDDAEELIKKLGVQAKPFAFDPFLKGLRADTHSLIENVSTFPVERIILYRQLWTSFFREKEWREEELADIAGSNIFEKILAETHLYILLGRDTEALEKIRELGEPTVPYMFYWLDLLNVKKEWTRIKAYIEPFIGFAKGRLASYHTEQQAQQFAHAVLRTIVPFCRETDQNDLYERALVSMLPYSYVSYDNFLFETGDYERWSALQAYIGVDLTWIGRDRIKVLGEMSPETLVILYHQGIQQQIDLKNRPGYKEAVRQLKKLRTLYKKLKRTSEWDEFLPQLIDRTKRLRAFHQECVRGKLIDA